jgi:putative transposase
MTNQLKKGSHSVYSIHLHVVFVTKYRRKVITTPMLTRLKEIFSKVCSAQKSNLLEFKGEEDHVHLLLTIAPDTLISQLVASLKAASSRLMRKEFAQQVNKFYWKPVFWHNSYCVISCGGAPLEIVKQYINGQQKPS